MSLRLISSSKAKVPPALVLRARAALLLLAPPRGRPFLPFARFAAGRWQDDLKVHIIVPVFLYNGLAEQKKGFETRLSAPQNKAFLRKAVQKMNVIFRNVGGHVEVYTLSGKFLFSADTTREAMEELAG